MVKTSIIFILCVLVEVIVAIFCMRTKSSQKRLRSTIKVCESIVFLMLVFIKVVKWGMTWYPFGVLIGIWGMTATYSWIRKREDRKGYKKSRVIGKVILNVLLLFICLIPPFLIVDYDTIQTTGKYAVNTVSYTYTDQNRIETYTDTGEHRKINVTFWYPELADGKYPLVVFSHGGMGIRNSNVSLYNELASNGYVVCSIDHPYQCLYTQDMDGHMTFINQGYMQETMIEDAKNDLKGSFAYYSKWMKIRMADMDYVMDYIISQSSLTEADKVYQLVDCDKMGVMGHSMGGSAALGIGRNRKDVRAVMALESPFMYDITGVEKGVFIWNEEPYPVPVLNIYSDASWVNLDQWPQYQKNNSLLDSTDKDTYSIHIAGVGHFSLTDLALKSPLFTRLLNGQRSAMDARDCLKKINEITLKYFDYYLKDKGEAQFLKAYSD